MNRETRLNEIVESFNICANEFKDRNNGLFCEIEPVYKSGEIKYNFAKIYFNNFIVVFKYTSHGPLSLINSILECFICLDKAENSILYPMYQIMDAVDQNNFDCLTFPLITDGDIMRRVFSQLAQTVEKYIERIEALSYDSDGKLKIFNGFIYELTLLSSKQANADNYDLYIEFYYTALVLRYTSKAYIDFLTGNYTKSIKQYEKLKNKTKYENRLLNEIKRRAATGETDELRVLPEIAENIKNSSVYGVNKSNFRELIAIFLSAFILTLLWAVPFCTVYRVMLSIEIADSIYLTGPEMFYMFLPSFLMGITSSYFFRHKAYKLLFKKSYDRLADMDYITNGTGSDKFMKGFSIVFFAGCLIFIILTVKCNIKFKQDGFIDSSDFFSMKGNYYSYSQVEKIYYNVLNFPSYVIMLKDGNEIDLYDFEETETTEEKIIPIFREKGITVEIGEDR